MHLNPNSYPNLLRKFFHSIPPPFKIHTSAPNHQCPKLNVYRHGDTTQHITNLMPPLQYQKSYFSRGRPMAGKVRTYHKKCYKSNTKLSLASLTSSSDTNIFQQQTWLVPEWDLVCRKPSNTGIDQFWRSKQFEW